MAFPIRLETKSEKVCGISFHTRRSWILASLSTGIIQLWDYHICILVEKFEGHSGRVRGISFHNEQPMFVSGGDDNMIKVWNYKQKRCIFTLIGHGGCVRSTFFHHELPWILSASDDKTTRIWNWQSRKCIANITDFDDCVTCARFHPTNNLFFAASLDGAVRFFDFSIFRQKQILRKKEEEDEFIEDVDVKLSAIKRSKFKSGANCLEFHNNTQYIINGCDNQVDIAKLVERIGRDKENGIYFVRHEPCIGHDKIVSSVVFDQYTDAVVSCSPDKTIRLWDAKLFNKKKQKPEILHVFRFNNQCFGTLASHPIFGIFAAGHENGLIVFKIKRERPAYCVTDNSGFYAKGKKMRKVDLTKKKDSLISILPCDPIMQPYYSLSINPSENAVILTSRSHNRENCGFDMYKVHTNSFGESHGEFVWNGFGIAAVWISDDRFVVLDEDKHVAIRDSKNNEILKLEEIDTVFDDIFSAGQGEILLKNDEGLQLFDVDQKIKKDSVMVNNVRRVVWSKSMEYAALLSKDTLTLINRKMEIVCTQNEEAMKSGGWDGLVFIYSTRRNIKYLIINGDFGIIRTMDVQLYILAVREPILYCLDKKGSLIEVSIDPSEYKFKMALINRKTDEVLNMIKSENLVGQSIIGYMVEKGYPDIALNFVKNDEKSRFGLALEFGDIEIALESAKLLNEADVWEALGELALLKGNHQIVEICYQKTKNFEKLVFLYFVTGNTEKLRRMMKIMGNRNDLNNTHFQAALLIGDIEERIQILRKCGQIPLAFLTAATHGYNDEADKLKYELEIRGHTIPSIDPIARWLAPPSVACRFEENWPLLASREESFKN